MQRYASDSQMFHIIKCRLCNAKYNINSTQQCEKTTLNETSASLGPSESVQVWRCNNNWIPAAKDNERINNQRKDDNTNKSTSTTVAENSNTKLARILCSWPYSQLEKIRGEHQKDGEFINACKMEKERRDQNYQNWMKEMNMMKGMEFC